MDGLRFFVVCTYIGEAAFLELRGISSSSLACVCAQIGASCIEADTAKKEKKNNWFDGRLKQSREIAEILARAFNHLAIVSILVSFKWAGPHIPLGRPFQGSRIRCLLAQIHTLHLVVGLVVARNVSI